MHTSHAKSKIWEEPGEAQPKLNENVCRRSALNKLHKPTWQWFLGALSRSRAEAWKGWGGQETAPFLTASFATLAALALEARLVRAWAGAVWAGARPGRAKLGISWAAAGATGNFFTTRGLWPILKRNKPDAHMCLVSSVHSPFTLGPLSVHFSVHSLFYFG